MSIKDSITGLILIDCWEPCYDDPAKNVPLDKWYELLSKKLLKKFNFIKILDTSNPQQTVGQEKYTNTHLKQTLGQEKYTNVRHPSDVVRVAQENNIANWLVVGASWQICTHLNSIGLLMFREVARDTGLKFYGIDQGFLKENEEPVREIDYILDTVRWIKKEKDLWLMCPSRVFDSSKSRADHRGQFREGPEYHTLRAKYENANTH